MVVDSGATCNIIHSLIKKSLIAQGMQFYSSSKIPHPYGSSAPLKGDHQATDTIIHGSLCGDTMQPQ